MKRLLVITAAMLALTVSAQAETRVSGADLLVDQAKLAGQEIRLEPIEITYAGNDGALIHVGHVTAKILWEGADPETMRWILKNCAKGGCNNVNVYVTPVGKNWLSSIWPALIKVRGAAQ